MEVFTDVEDGFTQQFVEYLRVNFTALQYKAGLISLAFVFAGGLCGGFQN